MMIQYPIQLTKIYSLKNDENSQWVVGLTDYNKLIIIRQNAVTILTNIWQIDLVWDLNEWSLSEWRYQGYGKASGSGVTYIEFIYNKVVVW